MRVPGFCLLPIAPLRLLFSTIQRSRLCISLKQILSHRARKPEAGKNAVDDVNSVDVCALRLSVSPVLILLLATVAHAQTVTTNITSSGLGTNVSTSGTTTTITGGTRPNNAGNLFHSFGNFSVGTGDTANFSNNTNLPTTNILSRVTGGNVSNIFGRIQTSGFGSAALWLINPAGVVFGPTASLNVGGSVHISTADYLRMFDGLNSSFFYANLSKNSQLTSAPITAFGFLSTNPAAIAVQGSTLTVPTGQSLSLVGGNGTFPDTTNPSVNVPSGVTITGGALSAPGGQVNLVSVGTPSSLTSGAEINVNGFMPSTSLPFSSMGPISLINSSLGPATIDASGSVGGSVLIRGGQLTLAGSTIKSGTTGGQDSSELGIDINLTGALDLQSASTISTITTGEGKGANITVTAQSMTLNGAGTAVSTSTNGTGNAGAITLNAGKSVSLTGGSAVSSSSSGSANAGFITVMAGESVTVSGSTIASTLPHLSTARGSAGNITIDAPLITIADGLVTTSNDFLGPAGNISLIGANVMINGGELILRSNRGAGGNVTVTVTDSFSFRGASIFTGAQVVGTAGSVSITAPTFLMDGSGISTASVGTVGGSGGNIDIHATTATLTGAGLTASSEASNGQAGRITVSATNSLLVDSAGIASTTSGLGNAGGIFLSAPSMTIQNGARVTTSSMPRFDLPGQAGSVTLQATHLNIINGGVVESSTAGTGKGGSVTITASGSMQLAGSNKAGPSQIATTTSGSGDAGQISITTPVLQVNGGIIKADTVAEGKAGNVSINASTLTLTNGTQIVSRGSQNPTTGKDATGDAGTVTVNVTGLFSSQGSTISSAANQGAGGDVTIVAGNIQLTGGSTVSAQSAGTKNAGTITLTSGSDILLLGSNVSTFAAQASGGNIKLSAPGIVQVDGSTITSSVNGPAGSNGGNITIDPQFVILQNGSQILAKAQGGNGGNITINADTFLREAGTLIDASSALGISGTINIQSPIQQLSGAIAPLPQAFANIANLYGQHCAAQKGGQFSSFVQGTRDGLPPQPGEVMGSPLTFEPIPSLSSDGNFNLPVMRLGLPYELAETGKTSLVSGCRSYRS